MVILPIRVNGFWLTIQTHISTDGCLIPGLVAFPLGDLVSKLPIDFSVSIFPVPHPGCLPSLWPHNPAMRYVIWKMDGYIMLTLLLNADLILEVPSIS